MPQNAKWCKLIIFQCEFMKWRYSRTIKIQYYSINAYAGPFNWKEDPVYVHSSIFCFIVKDLFFVYCMLVIRHYIAASCMCREVFAFRPVCKSNVSQMFIIHSILNWWEPAVWQMEVENATVKIGMFCSWVGKEREVIMGTTDALLGRLMNAALSVAKMHMHSKIEWILQRGSSKIKKSLFFLSLTKKMILPPCCDLPIKNFAYIILKVHISQKCYKTTCCF